MSRRRPTRRALRAHARKVRAFLLAVALLRREGSRAAERAVRDARALGLF